MRPEGPKIEAESREQGKVIREGQQAPSPPARGPGSTVSSHRPGFGAEPLPPKGFPLCSAPRMVLLAIMLLMWIAKKIERILSRLILSQLLCICLVVKLDVRNILQCRPRMLTRDLFAVVNLFGDRPRAGKM